MDRKSERKKIQRSDKFVPCEPELAYCSDCQDNRAHNQCPRLKKPIGGGKDIATKEEGMAEKKIQY